MELAERLPQPVCGEKDGAHVPDSLKNTLRTARQAYFTSKDSIFEYNIMRAGTSGKTGIDLEVGKKAGGRGGEGDGLIRTASK